MAKATSSAPSHRMLRVGEMVRAAITKILQRDQIREPDVEGVVITVSEVRMSPDLRIANAYVKALGVDDQKAVLLGLTRSTKFVRKGLGLELSHMKHIPEIKFREDTSFDNYNRIEQLLNKPEVLRDLAKPDEDPSESDQPDPKSSSDEA